MDRLGQIVDRSVRQRFALAYVGLIVVLLLGSRAQPVAATAALTITPAKIAIHVGNGDQAQQMVTLTNGGTEPLSLDLAFRDVAVGGGDQPTYQYLPTGSLTVSAAPFLTVSPTRLDLAPGERTTALIDVRPTAAAPGTYLAAFFASAEPMVGGEGSHLGLYPEVGTIIGVTVTGPALPPPATTGGGPQSASQSALAIGLVALLSGLIGLEIRRRR